MAIIFYMLKRSCLYIERLPIHNLYQIKEFICNQKQLKIQRIILNNEEHETLTVYNQDEQSFIYNSLLKWHITPYTRGNTYRIRKKK